MKRLISTTAIVTLLAVPVFAQTAQTGTTAEQTQSGQMGAGAMQAGQMEIQASSLIGQRLYIMRDDAQTGAMQQGGSTQQSTTGAGSGAGATDQAAQQTGEQPMTEGAETEQAQTEPAPMEGQSTEQAQTEPAPIEGQSTEQAQTEPAPIEGQSTEQAQAEPAPMEGQQSGMQSSTDMAELEQGISEIPDNWTMAGEIDDVLLTQEGSVQSLVIDAGGFLGMNESTRQVDVQQVRFVPDLDNEGEFYVVYTGDRASFEQSGAFDEASIPEGTMRGTETWGEEIQGTQSDVAFTSLTSDDLVGTAVYGSEDNWVGEISELALSESGDVEAVIVDVGGFLGIGQKPVALTMEQIQLRRGEGGLFRDDLRAYVNATEEELESLEEWNDG
jgi:hypothetical protein